MGKITKNLLIKELFIRYPEHAEKLALTLSNVGVACVGCCASAWETLEQGLKGHGKSDSEIEKIVKKLNEIIS